MLKVMLVYFFEIINLNRKRAKFVVCFFEKKSRTKKRRYVKQSTYNLLWTKR